DDHQLRTPPSGRALRLAERPAFHSLTPRIVEGIEGWDGTNGMVGAVGAGRVGVLRSRGRSSVGASRGHLDTAGVLLDRGDGPVAVQSLGSERAEPLREALLGARLG